MVEDLLFSLVLNHLKHPNILSMKKHLLLGLSMLMSLLTYAQINNEKFVRQEVKPTGNVVILNFMEIASQEAAGLLPPQHPWQPKKFKHPKPNRVFGMPDGYTKPNEEEVAAPKPSAIQVASPSPTLTFQALTDNNGSIPPDVNGAVGPNHVMTTLNTQVAIRNKTGTLIGSLVSLDNFFGGGNRVFDPKILYDPYNSRWIFTACANAELATSSLLVAVSATNDPTGTWYKYTYDVDATDTYWFDYPSIGFNKDWVAISGNMFPNGAGSYNGTKTYVIKKSDLYANATPPTSYTFTATSATAFTLVPAITYDITLDKIYVLEEWDNTVGTLRMLQITGVPPAAPAMDFTNLFPTGQAYSDNVSNDAPQSGSANKISTNDSRVQMVIYRNSSLWVTHTVFLPSTSPNRSSVQWWQINPTSVSNTGCVQQFGRIDDATGTNFFAFPSIGVNANSDVMVGFSRFSGSQFASANYAMRYATDAASTMRDNIVFKAGEASYFKDYGYGNNRWGDYTATTIDPTNDLDFWTLQEYASAASGGVDRWATQWAKVVRCIAPVQPSAFMVSTSIVCQGQSSVVYTVPAVVDATSYTWTYSGTGATFSSTTNSVSINYSVSATAGTLSVVANNTCGAGVARTMAITVNALPATPITSANKLTICSGLSAALTATGCVGTITWSSGATGSTINVTPTTTTVYTATCSASSCVSGISSGVSITVIPQNLAINSSTLSPFEAKDNITTTGTITIGGNTTYKAGNSIVLTSTPTSSISTNAGAVFVAKIEGCTY